jgi:hypothetical protein
MKKIIKIIFVILILVVLFIGIDAGVGFLKKQAPLVHWSKNIENGKVDQSLLYDIYYCYNLGEIKTTEIVTKKQTRTCPESDIILTKENLNIYSYKGFFNRKKYIRKADNKDELKAITKYITSFDKKYDDGFFDKRSVIIAYLPTGANSTVSFKEVLISDEIIVRLDVETAKADKDNTSGQAFFIEIEKDYLGNKELKLES